MPYIFLNTLADVTNFYVPTPIIVSGDYLTGQNNIKAKCDKIISHDIGCSAYLLSVSLVELLDVLEREGFNTVKVNRNGNHNLWILHKNRNSDRLRKINSIKKRAIQISKENFKFEENSSNSSFEKVERYNLSQFFKPSMKSEKSQTPPHLSLLGGGDFTTDVFSVYCQCDDDRSRMTNQVVLVQDHENTTDEKPVKLQKDFQNQMNQNDAVNSIDIGCQFNSSQIRLESDNYCDLKEIDKSINDIKKEEKKKSSVTVSDKNNPEPIVTKDKEDIVTQKNHDTFFNVKSDTTLTKDNDKIGSNSNSSIFDKGDSLSNFGLKGFVGNSKENMYDKTHHILVKLENRFKNEHEYFSNVRIKKSKKEKYTKKPVDNSKILKAKSGIVLVNLKDDMKKFGMDDLQNDFHHKSGMKLILDDIGLEDTINYGHKISNLTLVQSSESLNFYDALDTISDISVKDSFKSIINDKYRFKEMKRIDSKIKTKNVDSFKRFNYIDRTNNIDRVKKVKNVESSNRFHVTYKRSNIDNLKKITYTDKFSCNEYLMQEVGLDKFEKVEDSIDSIENGTFVDCYDDHTQINKYLYHSVTPGKIDKKAKPGVDHSSPDSKLDLFKKKMQMVMLKQKCDFKSRIHQRAERIQINQKQLKFVSSFRQRNCPGMLKEPIRNSKDIRELTTNKFSRSPMSTFANKERLPPVSPASHSIFQPSRSRRLGDHRH